MSTADHPVIGGPCNEQQRAAKKNLMGLLERTEDVKEIMAENFQLVKERDEKLEQLERTAESLECEAKQYAKTVEPDKQ